MENYTSEELLEFITHSNYIEREYSPEALETSLNAWLFLLTKRKRITPSTILEAHKLLFEGILNNANPGNFRDCAVMIGGKVKQNYGSVYLNAVLTQWIEKWCSEKLDHNSVKRAHVSFEKIHPFQDGNGRIGRLLMNIHCLNADLPILIIHEGEEQGEYYKWFRN